MCDSKVETVTPVNMSSILTPSVAQYLHPDYLQPLPTTVSYTLIFLKALNKYCLFIGWAPLLYVSKHYNVNSLTHTHIHSLSLSVCMCLPCGLLHVRV